MQSVTSNKLCNPDLDPNLAVIPKLSESLFSARAIGQSLVEATVYRSLILGELGYIGKHALQATKIKGSSDGN